MERKEQARLSAAVSATDAALNELTHSRERTAPLGLAAVLVAGSAMLGWTIGTILAPLVL